MLNAYEQHLLASYLANVASSLHHRDPEASKLAEWLASKESRLARGPHRRRLRRHWADEDRDEGMSAKKLRSLRETLRTALTEIGKPRGDRGVRRLRHLGRTLGLTRTNLDILELLLRYQTQPVIESMVDEVFGCGLRRPNALNLRGPAMPVLLGVTAATIHRRLRDDAPLIRSGLVSIDEDGDPTVVGRLNRIFTTPGDTGLDVHRLLLDAAPPSELEWSDFDHVAQGRDYIAELLQGALRTREAGVNIILYGPPGTGKTALCRALAERLGLTLYSVGESDESGDEPTRGERLQELRLAQRLLAGDRRSLLLFDEMEDLLAESDADWGFFRRPRPSRLRHGGSKVYLHRLLEQAPTPTLWTMNAARQVDETITRRMMYALELRRPNVRVRTRIYQGVLKRHGIPARPEEARSLAAEFEVSPGVATGATAGARLAGGDIAAVRHGVRSLSRLLGCDRPPQNAPPRFDLSLIRANIDPTTLATDIEASGKRSFSLCLQGAPGTGKSAFVRYLAERLGLEVLQKRASDVMSPWVGETEQRIAATFAEARDTAAFLVFDEADSLLADRQFAQRTWEVSRVNEMLTWMESHPLPFACTTNFAAHLDQATWRRFVFRVKLDYLEPAQAEAAFRGYFALTPPVELGTLQALTPGDFTVVYRKAEILGRLHDPRALATMLREECDAKPDQPRAIGFRP